MPARRMSELKTRRSRGVRYARAVLLTTGEAIALVVLVATILGVIEDLKIAVTH